MIRRFHLKWRSRVFSYLLFILAFLILLGVYLSLWRAPLYFGRHDSDHYFHVAVARMEPVFGVLRSLPQPENLRWENYFPDKEFLFHLIAGVAYQLGGEPGVEALVPLLGVLIFMSLGLVLRSRLGSGGAVSVLLSSFFLNPEFFNRCFFLRPHLLSILIFIWLVHFFLRGERYRTALTCGLFTLSYHAVYLPLIILLVGVIPPPGTVWAKPAKATHNLWNEMKKMTQSSRFKIVNAGIIGLILGTVWNPYFPSNLSMGLIHFRTGLGAYPAGVMKYTGDEAIPPSSADFIAHHFFILALIFLSAYRLMLPLPKNETENDPILFLWQTWLFTGVYFVLTGLNPRGEEYLVPLSVILLGALASSLPKRNQALGALLLLQLIISGPGAIKNFKWITGDRFPGLSPYIFTALEKIPASEAGKKIYNCDWSLGASILYSRPDLKFVDLLTPHFLYDINPEQSELWFALREGKVPDSFGALTEVFNADYALCIDPRFNQRLRADSRFESLYSVVTPSGVPLELFLIRRPNGPKTIDHRN